MLLRGRRPTFPAPGGRELPRAHPHTLHTQSARQDSRCGEPGARPRNGAPALQKSMAAARCFY